MHPVLFRFHSITIYSYGLCVALAALAAFWLAPRRARLLETDAARILDFVFALFVAGILGARVFYVWQHWTDYRQAPLKVFFLQEGGLVWYGGFFAAALATLFYARRKRWPVLRAADLLAPVLALAHAVGRIGCFLNGCCLGGPTTSRFGVVFPGELQARWPVQIFESVFLFGLSAFLFFWSPRTKKDGELFALYLLFYGAWRFGIEFFRADQELAGFWTWPQWASVFIFSWAILWLVRKRKKG